MYPRFLPILEPTQVQNGMDAMVDMVHGCSSDHLKACLQYKEVLNHKLLRWDKVMKFHQPLEIGVVHPPLAGLVAVGNDEHVV